MPVEPMLAAPTAVFSTGKALRGAWFEPKWDGYRAMVSTTATARADGGVDGREGGGGGVVAHVWSRRGVDITRAFPDVADAAAEFLPPGYVLDGELLIWGDGRVNFGALQRRLAAGKNAAGLARTQPANFMAFDLLASPDADLRARPLTRRRAVLEGPSASPDLSCRSRPTRPTPTSRGRGWISTSRLGSA
jgi:ATP-dependent DNA ligase